MKSLGVLYGFVCPLSFLNFPRFITFLLCSPCQLPHDAPCELKAGLFHAPYLYVCCNHQELPCQGTIEDRKKVFGNVNSFLWQPRTNWTPALDGSLGPRQLWETFYGYFTLSFMATRFNFTSTAVCELRASDYKVCHWCSLIATNPTHVR